MDMNHTRINRKKKLLSLIVPKDIEVLICSPGGVGTSFFLNHVNNYKVTNNSRNKDGFKHTIFPPMSFNKNIKFIYIYGNPIDSVISLFARNYHHTHSKSLLIFNTSMQAIDENTTLEKYANKGIDRFHFSEQFNTWLTLSKFYPTLFLKYEKIWDNLEILYDFLEIPKEELELFPGKKIRSSNISGLDRETQNGLKKIYGEFEKYINDFDDCLIVNARKKALIPGIFITKTFYYTARRSVARTILDISPALSDFLEDIYFSRRS